MAEFFWLPVCVLVVCAAVPLDKRGIVGTNKTHLLGKEELPVELFNIHSDKSQLEYLEASSAPFLNSRKNRAHGQDNEKLPVQFAGSLKNFSEMSKSTRKLHSHVHTVFQQFKNKSVDFHSKSFISEMKAFLSEKQYMYSGVYPVEGATKSNYRLYVKGKKSGHVDIERVTSPRKINKQTPQKQSGNSTTVEAVSVESLGEVDKSEEVVTSCQHVLGYHDIRWLSMVVDCPSGWPDDHVSRQCEAWKDLTMTSLDIVPLLPVQNETGTVFANVFCAMCHKVEVILPWTTKFICETLQASSFIAVQSLANISFLNTFLKSSQCTKAVVPSLPEAIAPCKVHSAEKFFSTRRCTTASCDTSTSDFPVSFNVLMNFDFTGDTHLLFSAAPKVLQEYVPRCREWETYDLYSQTCRPISSKTFTSPTENIHTIEQLRNVGQTALVSLQLNINFGDYLYLLFQDMDSILEKQVADNLNISVDRIKDVNVTFEVGSSNDLQLKVTTLTDEQYDQLFPPLVDEQGATTHPPPDPITRPPKGYNRVNSLKNGAVPNIGDKSSTKDKDSNRTVNKQHASNNADNKTPGNNRDNHEPKVDLVFMLKNITAQLRAIDEDIKKYNNSQLTPQTIGAIKALRYAFRRQKTLMKYLQFAYKGDFNSTGRYGLKSFRKMYHKPPRQQNVTHLLNGLDAAYVTENGTTFLYVTEPVNNRSDRIMIQAHDLATAALMTGVEVVNYLLNQSLTMRVKFVLVPPHDSHELGTHTLLQKINEMIDDKTFSIKVNGNNIDVISGNDTNDPVADASSFCRWGIEYMVYDDDFTMLETNNTTMLYINKTNSYIGVGLFDLFIMLTGSQNSEQTNLTDLSKYAFVCFMPRIVNSNCSRIEIDRSEYTIELTNRSIIFEEKMYDVFSYVVVNETTGKIAICVPESFANQQTFLPRTVTVYGGCSHDFDKALEAEGYLTMVLGRLSIFCLACVLVTYCLFPKLRNLPGVNTMNLTLALLAAEIIFAEGIAVKTDWLCSAVAVSLHYFFLAAHFWMNVTSYDVYKTFANRMYITLVRDKQRYVPRYAIFAWGFPFVIVSVCVFLEFSNLLDDVSIGYGSVREKQKNLSDFEYVDTEFGTYPIKSILNMTGDMKVGQSQNGVCWINQPLAAFLAFGAPILIIFFTNSIFFAKTILGISRISRMTKRSLSSRHSNSSAQKLSARSDVMLYLRMSTVMGFTWIFGLSSSIVSSFAKPVTYELCVVTHILAILFTIFNASQGAFIFFAFVFNRRVFALYCGLFFRIKRFILREDPSERLSSVSTVGSRNNLYAYNNR
ncbi:uncharacterized protein LOC131941982 [Physella acuta]|uniref:uncharacterized protein LOC131941982 n=1 Tax=Physella acuta TaxID=109671 RepID=UPI0027DC01A4|nr:uncharacterized protein LOC131941982 [Physella acuta]